MSAGHTATEDLRIALVGAGRIVERVHLPVLDRMPGVRLTALFDPDRQRATRLAGDFGIPEVCRTLDELSALAPDVALVANPNHLHAETSIRLLEAGIHVVCEKPTAVRATDAEMMLEAAERTGRELMVAFTNRFRPEIAALRQAVCEGHIGEITSIRCGWLRHHGIPGVDTWFARRAKAGGGALIDLGSHLIDLALWLGGRRRSLAATCLLERAVKPEDQATWYSPQTGSREAGSFDVESGARGFVVLEGPLDLFVEASWSSGVPFDQTYLHIYGKQGVAKLETLFGLNASHPDAEHALRIWGEDGRHVLHAIENRDVIQPYRSQWEFFLDSLRGGHSLRSSLEDSVATVRIVEALYESAARVEGQADRDE